MFLLSNLSYFNSCSKFNVYEINHVLAFAYCRHWFWVHWSESEIWHPIKVRSFRRTVKSVKSLIFNVFRIVLLFFLVYLIHLPIDIRRSRLMWTHSLFSSLVNLTRLFIYHLLSCRLFYYVVLIPKLHIFSTVVGENVSVVFRL